MQIYRIVLFGHRDLNDQRKVEEGLTNILKELLQSEEYIEIFIGRNGEFDVFAASVVKRVMKAFGNGKIGMTLVLPYPDKDIEYYYDYYDSVMIPECIGKTHPKGAITKRNKWMVEEADLVICFIEREQGGAYSAYKYAQKQGIEIINLANCDK